MVRVVLNIWCQGSVLVLFAAVTDYAVSLGDDDALTNPTLIHRSEPPLGRIWPTHT